MTEDMPVDHFASVLESIEATLPLLRASVARCDQPDGSLSATLIAIKGLVQVCGAVLQADDAAFVAMLSALHDDDGEISC
jgi:hypothetical protein